MEQKEYKFVLDACAKFGERDPQLWVQALSYFANEQGDCESEITHVLKHIETLNLLTPIQVIQMLSVQEKATLSVVRVREKKRKEKKRKEKKRKKRKRKESFFFTFSMQ